MSTIKKSIVYVVITLILMIYVFFEALNLNPFYLDGAIFYCAAITIYTVAYLVIRNREMSRMGHPFRQAQEITTEEGEEGREKPVPKRRVPIVCRFLLILPWTVLLIVLIVFSPLFYWKAYRDQLTTPVLKSFSEDISPVDFSKLPIVDYSLAKKSAEKKLGQELGLSSQVYLGTPVMQQVNGELVWAVPLHYSGFFKWLSNSSGTAGYIIVSATNNEDVKIVTDYKIKYQPNSYFMNDIYRHIRFSGHLLKGVSEALFQLDDSGKPYWVVSTYKNVHGYTLPEIDGIFLVDATTGKTVRHSLDSIPSWIDRVQPQHYIKTQIDNRGQYVHGFFNVANRDKYTTSKGEMIFYNNNRCYLFTGLTGFGSDESCIGFIMVDLITKETIQYNIGGTSESFAQTSAESKVQTLKYQASYPYIINVDGNPTYFMTLKNSSNVIKQYAMVAVLNYQAVGNGETVESALRDYKQALANSPSLPYPNPSDKLVTIEATISRIASETRSDITTYQFILEKPSNIIFLADSTLSAELLLTQPGDKVKITYLDNGNGIITVSYFDNLTFSQRNTNSTAWT